MDIAVEMMKAFLFPTLSEIQDIVGITRKAVTTAVMLENQAGQLPAPS